jgi:hypothetical protein
MDNAVTIKKIMDKFCGLSSNIEPNANKLAYRSVVQRYILDVILHVLYE